MTGVPLLARAQLVARAGQLAAAAAPSEPGFCDRIQYHLALAEPVDSPLGSAGPASGYATAADHWHAIPAAFRVGAADVQAGDLGFYLGGRSGAGHVALYHGGGTIVSSDATPGHLGIVRSSWPVTVWGLTFAGWARQWWHGATLPAAPVPVPTILPLAGWGRVLEADGQWAYHRTVNGVQQVIRAPLPPVLTPGGHWLWQGNYAGDGRWVWGNLEGK